MQNTSFIPEEKNLDLDKLITDNAKWMYMNKMKKNN
jgi:hypothetical protein